MTKNHVTISALILDKCREFKGLSGKVFYLTGKIKLVKIHRVTKRKRIIFTKDFEFLANSVDHEVLKHDVEKHLPNIRGYKPEEIMQFTFEVEITSCKLLSNQCA